MRPSFLLLTVSCTALLMGCSVGPDFKRPAAPETSNYGPNALPAATTSAANPHGAAQKFAAGQDIPAEWWTLFQSEPLNQLIKQALKANPDLESAQAALRAAQENTGATEGLLYPDVEAGFSSSRQKTSGASNGGNFRGSTYTLHNASVSVTYGLDIFGVSRRKIEQLAAEEDFQRFQLEAAYLSLTGNVVTTAIQEAALRGQINATNKIIESQQQQLDITLRQLEVGAIDRGPMLAQQSVLQQTRASLPNLEKRLAAIRNQLAVLLGQLPSQPLPAKFELSSLKLPETLPVSLPSKLVEQRPDIRAAEADMHAASAAIGVATAKRLPQILLTADVGSVAVELGKLFTPGSGFWSIGSTLSQTLFDGGTLAHQQGAAEAQYDVTAAQYRKTVLNAFREVADALHALEADAEALKATTLTEQASSESLSLVQQQFDVGAVSYINLLSAQQVDQQAKLSLVQAEAQRYADTAALFQALGGGWWNRKNDIAQLNSSRDGDKK
ncbi:MAG: efflux transporter outer membrane subunit [Alphaproteobacteria bacterium]